MTLAEIAQAVEGELRLAGGARSDDIVDGAVDTDSRELQPGGIFVAKPGEETDGHRFVGSAHERGAAVAIVEHPVEEPITQIVVDDSVAALGRLAGHVVTTVRNRSELTVIGITGSNGKTTTKNLVREILSRVGETVAPKASFNNEVGAPLTMLKVTDETRFLVAEMGASQEGDIARLTAMAKPDVGVVLKVGLAHAGGFGSIEKTFEAKSEMVTCLSSNDVAVLNRDDARVTKMAELTEARTVWFGQDAEAAVRASGIETSIEGTVFTLHLPCEKPREVAFRVIGEHHVSNALAAAAVAHTLGVDADTIVAGIEAVSRAERWRMELMGGARGVTVINDAYNASPDSTAAALRTLAQLGKEGARTVAVLGEMSELGEASGEEHDRIGLLVVRLGIERLVVVGEGAYRLHLAATAEGSWDGESVFVKSADEAFEYLQGDVQDNDTILVKSSNSAGLRFLGDRLGEWLS